MSKRLKEVDELHSWNLASIQGLPAILQPRFSVSVLFDCSISSVKPATILL
jgi:hypothetical protein